MPPPFRNANVCLFLRSTKEFSEIVIVFFHSIFNTAHINILGIRKLGGGEQWRRRVYIALNLVLTFLTQILKLQQI